MIRVKSKEQRTKTLKIRAKNRESRAKTFSKRKVQIYIVNNLGFEACVTLTHL